MQTLFNGMDSAKVIQFRGAQVTAGFTCRDLMEFARWPGRGRRVEVDEGAKCDSLGQFAMIHEGSDPWASWAISREGGQVRLWDCISLADLGVFTSVAAALAALPGNEYAVQVPSATPWTCQVIPLQRPGRMTGRRVNREHLHR
ncbi:MAG: hypothetical protein NVSMB18_16970 [Acetobacteraceae bacterium]